MAYTGDSQSSWGRLAALRTGQTVGPAGMRYTGAGIQPSLLGAWTAQLPQAAVPGWRARSIAGSSPPDATMNQATGRGALQSLAKFMQVSGRVFRWCGHAVDVYDIARHVIEWTEDILDQIDFW